MARIRPSDVSDARLSQMDAASRRVRGMTYDLSGVDVRDTPTKAPRRGHGTRCERAGCDAEATRFPGAFRCETCPDPVTPPIAAEVDVTGRDPRRRWPSREAGGSSHHDRHRTDLEESA